MLLKRTFFLRRLRLERRHISEAYPEVLLKLSRLCHQGIRNFRVFLEHRAILLAQDGLVFLQKGIPLLLREPERQLSRLGQEAEHVAIQRGVGHGGSLSLRFRMGGDQRFVVLQRVREPHALGLLIARSVFSHGSQKRMPEANRIARTRPFRPHLPLLRPNGTTHKSPARCAGLRRDANRVL